MDAFEQLVESCQSARLLLASKYKPYGSMKDFLRMLT